MWESGPFPKDVLRRVRNLDGNSTCMDCGQPETSWGGPTYGILLCVKCAGRHRSLGTHLSIIKSLTMDRWDAEQVTKMELGGNGQLQAWFAKCQTENSALEMKYRTKAATLYRDHLRVAAEEDLDGEGPPSRSRAPSKKGRIFAAAEAAANADLTREAAEARAVMKKSKAKASRRKRDSDVSRADGGKTSATSVQTSSAGSNPVLAAMGGLSESTEARRCGDEEYEVVFGAGSMGFTLMKDGVSRALVTRLAPGGMAYRLGVRTGDYLVGVDGRRIYDYDQLMLVLPHAPRPLRLLFEGAGAALAASPDTVPPPSRSTITTGTPGTSRVRGNTKTASRSTHSSHLRAETAPSSRRLPVASKSAGSPTGNSSEGSNESSSGYESSSSGSSSSSSTEVEGRGMTANESRRKVGNGGANVERQNGMAAEREADRSVHVSHFAPLSHTNDVRSVPPHVPSSDQIDRNVTSLSVHEGAGSMDQLMPSECSGKSAEPSTSATPSGSRGELPASTAELSGHANGGTAAQTRSDTQAGAQMSGGCIGTDHSAVVDESRDSFQPNGADVKNTSFEQSTPHEDINSRTDASIVSQTQKEGKDGENVAIDQKIQSEEAAEGEHQNNRGKDSARATPVDAPLREIVSKPTGDEAEERSGEGKGKKSERAEGRREHGEEKPSPDLSEGTKVLVRERKGSKWRKGLLRRRHGDGTWTIKYSGGMEERRVPLERIRLREAEGASGHLERILGRDHEVDMSRAVKPAPSLSHVKHEKRDEHRHRRSNRKESYDEDESSRRSTDVRNGSSGQNARAMGASSSLAWTVDDGTNGRYEEFRVPGKIRDDFFEDGERSSDSDVPALSAFARVDTSVPPANAPLAYTAPVSAGPVNHSSGVGRPMEGFGGGGNRRMSGGPARPQTGSAFGAGMGPEGSSQSTSQQPRELNVSFPAGSMGLTLTKEFTGGCSVTKIMPGGIAHTKGVALGQRVCAVNGQPSGTYEQTMAIIAGSPRPITITFVDPVGFAGSRGISPFPRHSGLGAPVSGGQSWADVGMAATVGFMDAANAVAVEWGIGTKTPGVLDEMDASRSAPLPPQGFRVHQKHSLMAIPTGVAGGFGNSLLTHRTYAFDVPSDMAVMSTKKTLTEAPGTDAGEFDVEFVEGELGMRLEERGSFRMSSIVSRITKDGQAMCLGVTEGCVVIGVNGEEYLSHAHTVATLKHAKRPIVVRFRAPEGRIRR